MLVWRFLLWWPIRRVDQALFAEALAEALDAGLSVPDAIALAGRVNPSRRFRHALTELGRHARAGYRLEVSMAKTGARIDPRLRAALAVGAEHACLAAELFAFARAVCPAARQQLCRAVGRRSEAVNFAAALARLLQGRGLTLAVVEAAARVVAAGNTRFSRVARDVVEDIENGSSLPAALRKHPDYFDPLYCSLLEVAESRQQLRACLQHLGQSQ